MLNKGVLFGVIMTFALISGACDGKKKTRKNKCNTCPSWKSEMVLPKEVKHA